MARTTSNGNQKRDRSGSNSIGDELYEQLRAAIISGQIPPNARIVETDISEQYQVSRTPVRQALQRLKQAGLLRESARALVVSEFSTEELKDFCAVRDNLESLAAQLAASSRTEVDLMLLEEIQGLFEKSIGGEIAEVVRLNHEFHNAVWEASRNRFLKDQLIHIRGLIERIDTTTLDTEERQRQALGEHRAIYDALVARDEEQARLAALKHFNHATAKRLLSRRVSSGASA
ncbi:MAG: GntR family transcriptional regulator [Actinobacteria bacterium]|nr:GntR family transcriptional regulator [Actinomycetota bacterium]MBS1881851.1 GntR family transcriptional regulator [Actinomycetota bacterium]